QIQERIELIKDGGGVTDFPAFLSTSLDEGIANSFSNECVIHFENRFGKNISWLSLFPSESEYLLEPTKILWTGYEFKNNKHIFHAKQVM
ncbi:MAG TPA: ADP-ribosyltransferase domain-containing protein, partial [Candidatus Berkiella sp.]|nr:ADP-ribosyltransferase domain-containing protein [Candidatus Berkiella sp.]